MVAFPDIITGVSPQNPFQEEIAFKTLATDFENGQENTKQKWLYPRRSFTLKYQTITKDEARTLWQFFLDRKGKHEPFNLFLPHVNMYSSEYVATGDGAETVFNLPSKLAANYTLYQDGAPLTEGVSYDYVFDSEGGADGADKITCNTAPPVGSRLTFTFTGRLKVRAKFAEDMFSFETFYDRLANAGVKLKGLLNA